MLARPPRWRALGGSVSARARQLKTVSTAPMPASTRNTPRQSVTCSNCPPMIGARIGASPITIISRAKNCAASMPE